jgi:ABC-type polysaccharide/polyol phosphate export permease
MEGAALLDTSRPSRLELIALAAAAACALGWLVYAFKYPTYTSSVSTIDEHNVVHNYPNTSQSLVGANGTQAVVMAFAPLCVILICAVFFTTPRLRAYALSVELLATILLSLFAVAGMLTVGPLILPTALFLGLACSMRHRQVADMRA